MTTVARLLHTDHPMALPNLRLHLYLKRSREALIKSHRGRCGKNGPRARRLGTSIPAVGCKCQANAAPGLLSPQPAGLKPFFDFCGVARSSETAAGIAQRSRLQKSANGIQRPSWDLISASLAHHQNPFANSTRLIASMVLSQLTRSFLCESPLAALGLPLALQPTHPLRRLRHFHHRSSRLSIGLTMLSAIGSIDLMRSARRSCTRWGMRPISYAQSGAGLSKKTH